jgi:hypothetical protein
MASDFLKPKLQSAPAIPKLEMDPLPRLKRQFDQLGGVHAEAGARVSKRRAEFWAKGDSQRQYIWDEVIGRLPNLRCRRILARGRFSTSRSTPDTR